MIGCIGKCFVDRSTGIITMHNLYHNPAAVMSRLCNNPYFYVADMPSISWSKDVDTENISEVCVAALKDNLPLTDIGFMIAMKALGHM